jgi:predicted dehydrogenase
MIRPMSLFLPAKTHPEVVIACVAARDRARAEKYAKKHGIEGVHDTYQGSLETLQDLGVDR